MSTVQDKIQVKSCEINWMLWRGRASFVLYLTLRKAPFPRFVILANGGDNYISYKHFANMKVQFMEIGCQGVRKLKKVGNHCYVFCTE